METGFVSTGLNETDNRVFILDRVQLAVSAPIVVVTVSNDTLVLVLETFQILRIDLQKEDQIECMYQCCYLLVSCIECLIYCTPCLIDIDIPRKPTDGLVTDAFFDPTGRHLIITTDRGENYYLYQKWQKCKPLKHLKVRVINIVLVTQMACYKL